MNYKEYKDQEQKEFNALPIFWAFSDKQFEDALKDRGIRVEEAKEHVYRFYAGGFYLKKDAPQIRAYLAVDRNKKLRELMASDLAFAEEAFHYEMLNHEYPINWQGDWDVCSCFGHVEFSEEKDGVDYLRELGFGSEVIAVYRKAAKEVQNEIEW